MKQLHRWDVSYSQAVALQKSLAGSVIFRPFTGKLRLVCGLDCAFSEGGKKIIAVAVVLKLPDFGQVERSQAVLNTVFPYIPGLLSFREAPVCIEAVKKLRKQPDVFIIDGQGVAHPRRLGLAAHLGLFFDKPTVGCAKSRLTGQFRDPGLKKGAYSSLKDKGRTIGAVVRTRTNVKPVFVSVGNKCRLNDAVRLVLRCTSKYRLPEPTRMAHHLVSKAKAGL